MAIISCKRVTGSPNIHYYEERAAAVANEFQRGDLVGMDTSGELILGASGAILGIVHSAAAGVDSTKHAVDVLMGDEFSIPWTAEATTETMLNEIVDLTFTTGAQVVSGTGSNDCVIIDFDDPVGTSGGRVIAKVIPAAQQMGGAAI